MCVLLQSFFGFGPTLDIELVLDGQDTRKTAEIKAEDGKVETHYLYYDGETIGGKVLFVSFFCGLFYYFILFLYRILQSLTLDILFTAMF